MKYIVIMICSVFLACQAQEKSTPAMKTPAPVDKTTAKTPAPAEKPITTKVKQGQAGSPTAVLGHEPQNPCQLPKGTVCVQRTDVSKAPVNTGPIALCEGSEAGQLKKAIELGKRVCDARKGTFTAAGHCPAADQVFYYIEWWQLPHQERWQLKGFRVIYKGMAYKNSQGIEWSKKQYETIYNLQAKNTQTGPPQRVYQCSPEGKILKRWVSGKPVQK